MPPDTIQGVQKPPDDTQMLPDTTQGCGNGFEDGADRNKRRFRDSGGYEGLPTGPAALGADDTHLNIMKQASFKLIQSMKISL